MAYKLVYLTMVFCFEKKFQFFVSGGGIFCRFPLLWGSISETTSTFWNILGFTY